MSAKHNYHAAAALPSHLTPADILAALHDHSTTLTLQALTSGHEKLPSTDPAILKDTFWYPTDVYPVTTYRVTENITYLPWFSWSKYALKVLSCYQNTPTGLKTRADSGGVVLRAEYRVLDGSQMEGVVEGEGGGLGQVDWVLVEDVEVVCAWWMMPVVKSKVEQAHRDICKNVVDQVVMRKVQEAVENGSVAAPLEDVSTREDVDSRKEREVAGNENVVVPLEIPSEHMVDFPALEQKAAEFVEPSEVPIEEPVVSPAPEHETSGSEEVMTPLEDGPVGDVNSPTQKQEATEIENVVAAPVGEAVESPVQEQEAPRSEDVMTLSEDDPVIDADAPTQEQEADASEKVAAPLEDAAVGKDVDPPAQEQVPDKTTST